MSDDVHLGATEMAAAIEAGLEVRSGHPASASLGSSANGQVQQRGEHKRAWLLRRMLLAADVLGLLLAFFIAQFLFEPRGGASDIVSPWVEFLFFLCAMPVWIFAALVWGLYDRDGDRPDHSTADDLFGVFSVVTMGSWIVSAVAWLTHIYSPNPPRMVSFWAMAVLFVMSGRAIARTGARRNERFRQNTLVVGAGDVGS